MRFEEGRLRDDATQRGGESSNESSSHPIALRHAAAAFGNELGSSVVVVVVVVVVVGIASPERPVMALTERPTQRCDSAPQSALLYLPAMAAM